MQLSLEIALLYKSFSSASEVWELLASTHPDYDGLEVRDGFNARNKLRFGSVGSYLRDSRATRFLIEFSEARIKHGNIANLELARLDLIHLVRDAQDAEQWLAKLLNDRRMVQARLYDTEYDRRQNAEDLVVFAANGWDTTGLPMKSNGLPHPLTQQIVDTDGNPGRWRLRRRYIESIGGTLWLGPEFWKLSGATRESLEACDGLVVTDIGQGVTKVTTSQEVFRSAEGAEGDLQNRMRRALFGP